MCETEVGDEIWSFAPHKTIELPTVVITFDSWRLIPVVEANSKCPKCARGTMKLIPSPEQLAPKLPEQNRLTAECDNCGHKDEVRVVATDE